MKFPVTAKLLTAALLSAASLTSAHAQVKQIGSVTAGHLTGWATTGVVQDAGTPANPLITGGLGIRSANQVTIGINNAANTGPYNQLGLGVTAAGGFISLAPFGGATGLPLNVVAKSLNFIVDGTTYPFPGTGSTPGGSSGNVQYNAAGNFGGVAGFTFDGTSALSLGVPGTSVGSLTLGNATSGTIKLQPTTGALGTSVITTPAVTGTMATQTTAVSGHCPQWNSSLILVDSGGACGGGGGGTIVIGTTPITGGSSGNILFDNAGFAGEYTTTGSGTVVALATSPVLVTPNLGTPSAATLTNATGLPIAGLTGLGSGVSGALANTTNALNGLVTFNGALGTPTSGNLANATNLPISAIAGLGTGVATLLGQTPSGTGGLVGKTSPSISGLTVTGSFTATGLVTNGALANPSTTVNGQTCTLGSTCTITATAGAITVGTTTVGSGTTGFLLYNNAGVLGNEAASTLAANPSGTAGPVAVNGSASTFMRSDGAPAIQLGTSSQKGLLQVDGQTIVAASGVISTTSPNVTKTTGYTIAATDMGGQVNFNGSSVTATIPAISSTVFAAGMSLVITNINATALTISSTPTINGFSGTSIPQYGGIACTSNGTSLDCIGVGLLATQVTLAGTGQVFTGGLHPTAFAIGTVSSGTTTVDCGNGPIQTLTNGGAFTLAMSANDGSCVLRITNNGSAGTITFSGFSEGANTGDAITTTNTSKFDISLTRIGANPHWLASALQ